MIGWIVAAYCAGALALLMGDADVHRHTDELVALVLWPIAVPVLYSRNRWQRHRTTCRYCRARWRDRAAMLRHVSKAHSAETGEKP